MMFMMVGTGNCPTCGVSGRSWKGGEGVFICPNCSTVFSEFGIVQKGEEIEVKHS